MVGIHNPLSVCCCSLSKLAEDLKKKPSTVSFLQTDGDVYSYRCSERQSLEHCSTKT